MNYIYSFKVEDGLPYLKGMPEDMLGIIESDIVRVINESFVITADQDYLTARFLSQKGLGRAFFWSASQSIEKYLKTFLLMNGESIRENSDHKLFPLLTKASRIDQTLRTITIDK